MSNNTTTDSDDDLRCGAPTQNGECRQIATFADGRCSRHTGRETNPLRETHRALVEEGGTICSQCGQSFPTDAAYDAHDCPETQVSRPKKAARKAKAGGQKATAVTKQEFWDLFEDFTPADFLAIIVGVGVGNMVGHDFDQAITIALAVGGGGVLDAARKKKQSKFDPVHLKFVRQRAEWFILGFAIGAFYIFAFHESAINAPEFYYDLLEQLWHVFGIGGVLTP